MREAVGEAARRPAKPAGRVGGGKWGRGDGGRKMVIWAITVFKRNYCHGLGLNQSVTKITLKNGYRFPCLPSSCRVLPGAVFATPARLAPNSFRASTARSRPPFRTSTATPVPLPCEHRRSGPLSVQAPPPEFGCGSLPLRRPFPLARSRPPLTRPLLSLLDPTLTPVTLQLEERGGAVRCRVEQGGSGSCS